MVRILIYILLLGIIVIDIKYMIIPNGLTILLLVLSIIERGRDIAEIENGILGMATYTLPFLFIYGYVSDFIGREAIGFGDIKLVLSFGYLLGYTSFKDICNFIIYSSMLASIYGIVFIQGLKKKEKCIPFAPFLTIGFLISFL